jgi:hypothetical protein
MTNAREENGRRAWQLPGRVDGKSESIIPAPCTIQDPTPLPFQSLNYRKIGLSDPRQVIQSLIDVFTLAGCSKTLVLLRRLCCGVY